MTDQDLNVIINKYVKEHLSPKPEQREYITEKYRELCEFLSYNCFQSGSYPRYTAVDPVHDLDVIHPVKDLTLEDDPALVIDSLYGLLVEAYANSKITKVKRISRQTHSITIEFADADGEFSIDLVPAVELPNELNEFDLPLYCVPEILELNRHNRQIRYAEADKPVSWIKSDPRGYIKASHELNESNSGFRHAAKLIKSWRHACKMIYGDKFKLKSFHLEQIVYTFFISKPDATTAEAVIDCFAKLPVYLQEPQFADRADPGKHIDDYIAELLIEEKNLIIRLQSEAFSIIRSLPGLNTEEEVRSCLDRLLTIRKSTFPNYAAFSSAVVAPSRPWGS